MKSKWESSDDHDDDDAAPKESIRRTKKSKKAKTITEPSGQPVSAPQTSMRPAPTGFKSCRSLTEYSITEKIAEGTYGVVYHAKHVSTGKHVALKRIKLDLDNENGFGVTALREIQALMRVRGHPFIIQLYDMVLDNSAQNDVYMSLEFIEYDLKTLMSTMDRFFLIGETKTILLQVLSATAYLHDHWIVHRDLKSSNILISPRTGDVKLADFGMARMFIDPDDDEAAMNDDHGDVVMSSMTPVVVTLWYRAPELLLGETRYGGSVDLWSIGCLFAELIQGDPLFQGRSDLDQLSQIFKVLGVPSDQTWPGFSQLPHVQEMDFRKIGESHDASGGDDFDEAFKGVLNATGMQLLRQFLTCNPRKRMTALQALEHPYFTEVPLPKPLDDDNLWPSRSQLEQYRKEQEQHAPPPPVAPGSHQPDTSTSTSVQDLKRLFK